MIIKQIIYNQYLYHFSHLVLFQQAYNFIFHRVLREANINWKQSQKELDLSKKSIR